MDEESVVLEVKIDDQSQDRSPLVSPTGRILPDPAERAPKPGSRGASGETVEDDLKRARESLRRAQATVARRKRELQNVLKVTDSAGESEDILTNAVRQARASFARNARPAGIARAFGRGAMTAASMQGGIPFATLSAGLAAATSALWAFREGLNVAREAVEFSPRLAATQEFAAREELFGRMKQAQAIEDQLSELVASRSNLAEEFRELKTELLRLLLPFAQGGAEAIADVIRPLAALLGAFNDMNSLIDAARNFGIDMLQEVGLSEELATALKAILDPLGAYLDMKNNERLEQIGDINAELEDFLNPDVFLEQISHQRSRMPQQQPRGRYRTR